MTDKPLTAEEIDKWLADYSEQPIGMLDGTATRICAAARASVDSELTDDAYQPGGPMSRLRAQVEYLTSDGDEQIVALRDALSAEGRETMALRAENERMRARDWDLDNDVLLRENDRLRAEVERLTLHSNIDDARINDLRAENGRLKDIGDNFLLCCAENEVMRKALKQIANARGRQLDLIADAIRDERERCAKIAEARAQPDQMLERYPDDYAMGVINTSNAIAAAIREGE
jgi:hypothetical protein